MWKVQTTLFAFLSVAYGNSLAAVDAPVPTANSLYFPDPKSAVWPNPNATEPAEETSSDVAPFPMPKCYGLTLEEATIDDMQGWMSSGKLTARKLAQCYIGRINQLNEYVNAVLELNPDALSIADQLDYERSCGKVRGPLHGIPFLVKDNIATKDKMETTAGSYSLLGSIVPRDAHIVKLLRKQGALLLGKATLDEWASMRTSFKSSGYAARGGQSRNSYNLSTAPGGSSSGSAQAVASNMIPFSFGTETDGSVIGPARRANIIGIKPTVGLTSRAGVVPESLNQDTVGSFGRTFKDAVYAFQAIVGIDSRDNATLIQQAPKDGNYLQFIAKKDALKGLVIGLPWFSLWNQTSHIYDMPKLLEVVKAIEDAGAIIINGTEFPHYKDVLSPTGYTSDAGPNPYWTSGYRTKVDFYNNIRDYLAELEFSHVRSLEDIVAFNNEYTGVEGGVVGTVAGFMTGQDNFDDTLLTGGAMNESYWEGFAYLEKVSKTEGIDAALSYTFENGTTIKIDTLLVPSGGGSTNLPATAGYPMITIPAGFLNPHGVPVGISVVGTAWSEPSLIRYASAMDDLIRGRTKPTFVNWWSKVVPVDYSL